MAKVLIACEESQEVCKAFRAVGHEAYSCDLLPCSGGYPEWHIQDDLFNAFKLMQWDFIGLHCPCTYTALSGNRWYYNSPLRMQGVDFTKKCYDTACNIAEHVYLEQPKTIMQKHIGKRSQVIQPYQFGHGETKETWLWLKNLPSLKPTDEVPGRDQRIFKMPPSKDRGTIRSKTFPGIAKAMADQWGLLL